MEPRVLGDVQDRAVEAAMSQPAEEAGLRSAAARPATRKRQARHSKGGEYNRQNRPWEKANAAEFEFDVGEDPGGNMDVVLLPVRKVALEVVDRSLAGWENVIEDMGGIQWATAIWV